MESCAYYNKRHSFPSQDSLDNDHAVLVCDQLMITVWANSLNLVAINLGYYINYKLNIIIWVALLQGMRLKTLRQTLSMT